MRLSELIAAIGDENIMVQQLQAAIEGPQRELSRPTRTRLSFITDEALGAVLSGRRVGLILWIDRDKLNSAKDALQEPTP